MGGCTIIGNVLKLDNFIIFKFNVRHEEERRTEQRARQEAERVDRLLREAMADEIAAQIEAEKAELAKNARARMFWVYQTRDIKALKVKLVIATMDPINVSDIDVIHGGKWQSACFLMLNILLKLL